ncbi:MAG: hypothetical protein R3B13_04560 [Polyangiaceae bacterium]
MTERYAWGFHHAAVAVCALFAATPAIAQPREARPQQAQVKERPRFAAGLKFGTSLIGACDECGPTKPGTAFGVEAMGLLAGRIGLGFALDWEKVAASGAGSEEDRRIATYALLLRFIPLWIGPVSGSLDLAGGASNRGAGAFAGIGIDYEPIKGLRVGPYARLVWVGSSKTRNCNSSTSDCSTTPVYGHTVALGLSITALHY